MSIRAPWSAEPSIISRAGSPLPRPTGFSAMAAGTARWSILKGRLPLPARTTPIAASWHKRALAPFGNLFGLCLYDKEQRGVEDVLHPASVQAKSPNIFRLHSPEATML